MIWLFSILLFICLLLSWFLISPLVLETDTRIPGAMLKWVSIGKARIWYDHEWWLSIRVLFFRKTIKLSSIKAKQKKLTTGTAKKKKRNKEKLFRKMIRVMRTFQIEEWRVFLDSGDDSLNARIYGLNFLPLFRGHLQINFNDENYLFIRIRNRPMKILWAFLR